MDFQVTLLKFILLSAVPIVSHAKVDYFLFKDFRVRLYSAERITTSCETLPHSKQNRANSIKTDTCILLYSNEFCVGSFFKVEPGEHPSLPYFKNQVASYRACTDVSKDEPWRDVRIKFYLHDESNEILWDTPITPECVPLPTDVMGKASAVNPDICVILFSQPNCTDRQYKVESAGYDRDLADFNDATNSFMPCNASDIYRTTFRPIAEAEEITSNISVTTPVNLQSRVEFFLNADFGGTSHNVEMVTTTCENLPDRRWFLTSSIKTEGCIILYGAELCRGCRIIIEAGNHSKMPYFNDKAVSYRACSDVRKDQQIGPLSPDDHRIQFFDHYNYNGSLWDTAINPNCTTLPETIRNRTSSLKSDICVILFSGPDCVGSQFLVQEFLWDNSLEYFQDKLVSFKPCDAGETLNRSVVLTATTKSPSVETFTSTTVRANTVAKSQELPIPHNIENHVSENLLKIQPHSKNSFVFLAAIGLVVAVRFIVIVILFILTVWMCFMHRGKILLILKRAWRGNNDKANHEMSDIQTL